MENQEFKKQLIARAFNLAKDAFRLVDKFPNKRSTQVIANQLLRAISSIGANIVEAQAASSRRDFANFLNHALKSGNESKFWLALAKEIDENLNLEIDKNLKETDELVRILGSCLATMKGSKKL